MDEGRNFWVQFEGPGKLHVRRWHLAKPAPVRGHVTLCGMRVRSDDVTHDKPGEGMICATCHALTSIHRGGHY